jgi:tetratricopeptide (TPR) repeat protein
LDFLSPGKRIKALRKHLNIKQVELEAIGVSRNYISMVESDKRNLTKGTLEKFLEFIQNKADEIGVKVNLDTSYLLLPEKEEARNYCNIKLESTLNHQGLDELIKIGEKYNLIDILLKVYLLKANRLYDENLYNTAFIYYYNILDIYINNNDDKNKAPIYLYLSKCKINTLSYEEALSYLFKANFYCNEFNDKTNLTKCIFNIALTYKKLGEYDNSLIYLEKLLTLFDFKENLNKYLDIILLKCICYFEKKDYQTALNIYNSTLDKFKGNLGFYEGMIYSNLGLIYLEINEPNNALSYFNKAISSKKASGSNKVYTSIIDMSLVYIQEHLYYKAISLLYEGISLAKEYSDKEYIVKGYYILENIYIELNDKNNLKEVYLLLIENLEDIDSVRLLGIYIKLSILYMEINNVDKSKECLYEAEKIQKALK